MTKPTKTRRRALPGSAKQPFADARYVGPARKSDRVEVTVRLRRRKALRSPTGGAGFRRIGVRRGARISRGRPTDIVLMDAVPADFGASVLR